jgi:anti-sigma factor RsiW
MKCRELLAALGDYIDGELEAEICEEFRRHLEDCEPCEVVIDNLRQTITVYRDGEPYDLPGPLHDKLHSLLRARFAAEFSGTG